jgi:hypothetical protein
MSSHRHQSSLEGVLDFSEPFSLTKHQSDTAKSLLDLFIEDYGVERETERGYKPAKLIHEMLQYVISRDSFLVFIFTFLHENLTDITSNMTLALSYFGDFTSWVPAARKQLIHALEGFANYMVAQFFLPRGFLMLHSTSQLLTEAIQSERPPLKPRNQLLPRCQPCSRRPPLAQNNAYLS